jgi:GAF domain-containing protein
MDGGKSQDRLTDPARVAAVRSYEVLDAPRDGAFERFARMAAAIFATPISTVSIVDSDRVWFAAAEGLDGVDQVGVEPGLCASAVLLDEPYVVLDATLDPRTLDHPLVRGALGLQFYAAAPVVNKDGHGLGTVSVIDRLPRQEDEISSTQIGLLSELAGAVADLLDVKLAALTALRVERQALSGAPLWALDDEVARRARAEADAD